MKLALPLLRWLAKWAALLAMLLVVLWLVQHMMLVLAAVTAISVVVFPVMGAHEAWGERKWRRERAALADQPDVHDQRLP